MTLSLVNNYSGDVANRFLRKHDADATGWLTKLSSGKRVYAARQDAASLAIGSRLATEVGALKQASVNVTLKMLSLTNQEQQSLLELIERRGRGTAKPDRRARSRHRRWVLSRSAEQFHIMGSCSH